MHKAKSGVFLHRFLFQAQPFAKAVSVNWKFKKPVPKRKPHDSCFVLKNLNSEELSWGDNTLPKPTGEIIEGWFGILSLREFSRLIGYCPAAVSRVIKRNSNKNGAYDAESVQMRANWQASKDKNAGKRTPFRTADVATQRIASPIFPTYPQLQGAEE